MNDLTYRIKTYFNAARRSALATAALVFACLMLIWWQLGRWYQDRLLVEQRAEVSTKLAPYGNALTQSINRRFALLDGLSAFVHSELDSHEVISEQDFENFANGVSITVAGVRGLSIAPGAVQQFVFPHAGNEAIIGMNLLDGNRPDVIEDIQRTIQLRQITLSGPYPSRDGETLVLVARLAVFREEQFWGLVTMTLDVPSLLTEAGLESQLDGLTAALRDSDGEVFYGDETIVDAEPVAFGLELPEGRWELAAVPTEGWQQAIQSSLFIAHGSGLIVVILVTGMVYLTVNRQQRLSDGIVQRTRALSESEERLRETLTQLEGIKQHTPDLITIIDREGRYLMINQATGQLLGKEPEQVVGKTFAEVLPPETANTFMSRLQIVFETEQPLQVEDEVPYAEGTAVYTTTLFPLFDQEGVCYAAGGIAKDITNRVRAEQALRESEEKFRAIFEVASVGIVQVDTQDGQLIRCNETFCEITGYTRDELLTMTFPDLTHPEDRQRDWALFSAAVRGEIPVYTSEKRYIRKNGSVIWVRLNAGFIRDVTGQPIRTVAVCEDITERIAAEAERERLLMQIQDQARQLRDVMSTVPEGVLLLDKEGHVLLANPVAERALAFLTNIQSGDAITHIGDRPLADLLTSPLRGMWHEVKKGTRTFEIIARPVANGPEPEKWVLVIQDVTEERTVRRRIEIQERLASVGQLAAGIAHDFNNLIAVIALYAQMGARDPDLPTRHQERSGIILEQTRRATELVQQVLTFSRQTALDRRPTDLLLFLKEQVKLLERTIPEDISIKLNYTEVEYVASADPTQMQQVVMNLAVNARDAMPQGGRLSLELEYVQFEEKKQAPLPGMEAGEWVRITVSDTGVGIPTGVLPHIFEPFFTTKEVGEGTGLGLAQVWGIVKQHEGFIDVSSAEGEGTTFTLYLPALSSRHPERLPAALGDLPQGDGQTLLVVEDNATLRNALTESLLLLNYRVLEAANGHEALSVLEQQAGDVALVLSDLVMPVMGGAALFYALKEKELEVPMILLTGHMMEDELKGMQAEGLSGYLLKPPDTEELARTIVALLGRSSQ